MKLSQAQEEKLFEYVDGTMSVMERESFEQLLKNSPAMQSRLDELSKLNATLRSLKPEQPSKNFTQSVMSKLDQYPIQRRSFSSLNGILLLAGILIIVGISSLLVSRGVFDITGSINLNQSLIPNEYFKQQLPSIPFNGKLIVNVIIILNLGLAFLVLDRAVLKPWFEKRTKLYGGF